MHYIAFLIENAETRQNCQKDGQIRSITKQETQCLCTPWLHVICECSLAHFPGSVDEFLKPNRLLWRRGPSVCWADSLKAPTVQRHTTQEDSLKIRGSGSPDIIEVRQFMLSTILIHNAGTDMQRVKSQHGLLVTARKSHASWSIFWSREYRNDTRF